MEAAPDDMTDEEDEHVRLLEAQIMRTVPITTAGIVAYLDLLMKEMCEVSDVSDFEAGLLQNVRKAIAPIASPDADAALLATERRFQEACAEARVDSLNEDDDDDARDQIFDRSDVELDIMIKTPATTIAGAASKLRAVLDPVLGTMTRDLKSIEPMLQDVLAVVERLADA